MFGEKIRVVLLACAMNNIWNSFPDNSGNIAMDFIHVKHSLKCNNTGVIHLKVLKKINIQRTQLWHM